MPSPEDKARENIDALLDSCGWQVQDKSSVNLQAARGIAVRELSFKTGEPDYTLFVDGKAIGTVEAKPVGHSLIGVEEQSEKYVKGVPFGLPAWRSPLPFSYESTGTETRFTNHLDPEPRSRNVFAFHRPETLLTWVQENKQLISPKRGGAIATNKKRQLEISATTDLNVMGLKPHSHVLGYFWWWFSSIDLASLSDGSNVSQVNNKDVLPLAVSLPSLAEQARIVAEVERRLSVVEELEAVVAANFQRATRLRQSILQQAFSGKLSYMPGS